MPRGSAQRIAAAILITLAALPLVVPVLALAGSGRDPAPDDLSAQYDTRAENLVQQQTGDSGDGAIENRVVGSLPLTDLDVVILTAAAMSLAGFAIAFRILSRPRRPVHDPSSLAAPSPVLAVAKVERSGLPPHAG